MNALMCNQPGYKNHRVKDELLKSFLQEEEEDEIILFTDGYDSLLLANEKEILDKFHQANTDLLFSAETNCYPDPSLEGQYPATSSPYRFLNSGGFIGRAGVIRNLLATDETETTSAFTWSNQYQWTLRYLKQPFGMRLDTGCEIFCTFSPEVIFRLLPEAVRDMPTYSKVFYEWFHINFEIRNGRIFNRITKTWPCNAHFCGPSSLLLRDYPDIPDMLYTQIPGSKNITIDLVNAWLAPA